MEHKYVDHPVHDRLHFAERRLNDLCTLNGGDFGGACHRERQPLLQEFFFHLCGAIDFLAQEVNVVLNLGLSQENVTVSEVCKTLSKRNPSHPIITFLTQLHPNTKRPLLASPYSDEGSHYRIIVFRNFVSHIRHNPVSMNVSMNVVNGTSDPPSTNLFIDPRLPHTPQDQRTPSNRSVIDELALFLELVISKCNLVLKELGISVS